MVFSFYKINFYHLNKVLNYKIGIISKIEENNVLLSEKRYLTICYS